MYLSYLYVQTFKEILKHSKIIAEIFTHEISQLAK